MPKDPLTQLLCTHFSMHPSRLKTTAELILGFLSARHIHHYRLATCLSGEASLESKCKTVSRYFAEQELDEKACGRLTEFFLPPGPWILSLDRTNWTFGTQNINILTLAVVVDGIAVPLFTALLDKKGNSSTDERKALLTQFVDTFGVSKINVLLGDREFIGGEWIRWLDDKRIPFCIRIKKNQWVTHPNGWQIEAGEWFKKKKARSDVTTIASTLCQIHAKRLESGELLALISSIGVQNPLTLYRQRWGIETMFKALKTNGFQLEATHVKNLARLKKLVLLAQISFGMAVKSGHMRHLTKAIPQKKVWDQSFIPGSDMDLMLGLFTSKKRHNTHATSC